MALSTYYDEIAHCNKCGFCQVACPVFRATGHESGVARGRLALLRAIIEGRLDWSPEIEAPLFDCLLCGACTSNCFPAIPTADLVVQARTEYLSRVGRKPVHRLLFDQLLPYPNRLHMAAAAVALGKKARLSRLAEALGLLRIFGRDFVNAQEIVETLPLKALRDRRPFGAYPGRGSDLAIGYFVGCGVDIIQQEAGEATFELMQASGQTVAVLDNCCCGLPAWSFGDTTVARRLAEKNLQRLDVDRYDVVVTDCSSCAAFLKKYPALFPPGDARRTAAETLAAKVRDLAEWLTARDRQPSAASARVVVTYHDPCHAVRGQGLAKQPREILKRIPGVDFVDMPEADWCCGGAGAYALTQYDRYRQVLDRKIANIRSTGADIVATSCPACMIHLSYGLRKHGLPTRVRHLSEMVARA